MMRLLCLLFGHQWQKVGYSWYDYELARFYDNPIAPAMLVVPHGFYCERCNRFERLR